MQIVSGGIGMHLNTIGSWWDKRIKLMVLLRHVELDVYGHGKIKDGILMVYPVYVIRHLSILELMLGILHLLMLLLLLLFMLLLGIVEGQIQIQV